MTLLSGALPQPACSQAAATPAAAATQPASTATDDSRTVRRPMPAKTDLISALLPGSGSPVLPHARRGSRAGRTDRRLAQRGPLQPRIDRSGEAFASRGVEAGERRGCDGRQLQAGGPQILDPALGGDGGGGDARPGGHPPILTTRPVGGGVLSKPPARLSGDGRANDGDLLTADC